MSRLSWTPGTLAALAAFTALGCEPPVPAPDPGLRAPAAEGVAVGVSTSEARFVRNLIGFQGPESVKYDADQDVYFVTNQAGAGSERDGNGYIVRVSASNPDSAFVFAQGGRDGVVLDAPKGTALHGDTLWVCDITVLRAFDRRTGAPLANVDLAPLGAVQLNDVDVGPDGMIRVTDTGIIMSRKGVLYTGPSRVYVRGPGGRIDTMATSPSMAWPNGIRWDPVGRRWIVASFDPFNGRIYAVPVGGGNATAVRDGPGRLDGVQVLADGTILFASWADSSIRLLAGGSERPLIRELPEPADIGLDTRRNRLAVPLSTLGRVQLWSLGTIGTRVAR